MKTILVTLFTLAVLSACASAKIVPENKFVDFLYPQILNKTVKPGKVSNEFIKLYQKTFDLNKMRFKNLNKIYVGDTVLIPEANGNAAEIRIVLNHDCLWKMVRKYFNEARSLAKAKKMAEFTRVYTKTLDLNRANHKNLNLIRVGDRIIISTRDGKGTVNRVAVLHDCIEKMVKNYLAEEPEFNQPQQVTKVTKPILLKHPIKIKPNFISRESSKIGKLLSNKTFWVLLVIIGGLAVLTPTLLKKIRGYNPDVHPTIPDGLDENPLIAVKQINAAYPGRGTAMMFEAGVIKAPEELWLKRRISKLRDQKVPSVKVTMSLADGEREVDLMAGEIYYRITREDSSADCFAQKSGNLLGTRFREGDKLPEGWGLSLYEKMDFFASGSP